MALAAGIHRLRGNHVPHRLDHVARHVRHHIRPVSDRRLQEAGRQLGQQHPGADLQNGLVHRLQVGSAADLIEVRSPGTFVPPPILVCSVRRCGRCCARVNYVNAPRRLELLVARFAFRGEPRRDAGM